jgi:hypothetical protein
LSHEGGAGVEVGKELDCFLEGLGEGGLLFHERSIS